MLNPDGVVVGNYRCGLAGLDLNREYREPGPHAPTIRALKEAVRAWGREREVWRARAPPPPPPAAGRGV
jgi:murein tripeptide amidase MpaA